MLLPLLLLIPVLRAASTDGVVSTLPVGSTPARISVSTTGASVQRPPAGMPLHGREPVRGVHMTGWAAGSAKNRQDMVRNLKDSGLNAVVIALKETDGLVFVKNVGYGTYVNAIPDLEAAVRDFKEAGIYTIGRIVLFKDDRLARKRPDLAVKRLDNGEIWVNDKGVAWVDPYHREVWDYNLAIASRASAAGFDEIQLDYIRFPSDGPVKLAVFSKKDHTNESAKSAVIAFLKEARRRLPGVVLSACVFGMTTSAQTDMGIGQDIVRMAREVDFISPMMYPSHYYRGEYGIKHPNSDPYRTILYGIRDALQRLGPESWRLRPYYQDFSLGVRYDAAKVRDQVLASERLGVVNWLMWNPQNRYTWTFTRHNNQFIFRPYEENP